MREMDKSNRPNSDEILSEINRDALNLNNVIECEQYKESKKTFVNDVKIEECFHLYFIQEKFKKFNKDNQ
jgi:hypothetical protein